MTVRLPFLTLCFVGVSWLPAIFAADDRVTFDARERRLIARLTALPESPPSPSNRYADDPRARELGQRLFFDPGLAADGKTSCVSCHDPAQGFSDGRKLAQGVAELDRHTMPLFNLAHQRWYFWDGRADSLWAQALDPIEEPREMASSRVDAARHVFTTPALRKRYEAIFGAMPPLDDTQRFPSGARPVITVPGPPAAAEPPAHAAKWNAMRASDRDAVNRVFVNIGKSIAAYERQLVSRDSAFDRFAQGLRRGDLSAQAAMSASARRGLKLFVGKAGCRTCHFGPNFTDREFHNNRVAPLAGGFPLDPGRYAGIERLRANPFNRAGRFSDEPTEVARRRLDAIVNGPRFWSTFKTPSLRSVALSPPYMHQGQFATLRDVVEFYNTLEGATRLDHHAETVLVPLGLTDPEVDDLVAFLESLTGAPLDPALLRAPIDDPPPSDDR